MSTADLLERYPHLPFRRNWHFTDDVHFLLGECLAYIRILRQTPLLPEDHRALLTVYLRKGALATTAIEGNTLSPDELDSILDHNARLPDSKQYQGIEVENILSAMNQIKDDLVSGKDSLVDAGLLIQLHYLISRGLGDHIDCIPGRFRTDNRTVGNVYRAPDYSDISRLVDMLCNWMREEFGYPQYRTEYSFIIQSIVAHIYIELIHPFADGNGRTGRLLEFYILVRGGMPVVAATLLSNHYNQTRGEYYRHFVSANQSKDLSAFIQYAVRGLRDGLVESLRTAQKSVMRITWQHLVYNAFRTVGGSKEVIDRRRDLVLHMDLYRGYSKDELLYLTPKFTKIYARHARMGQRDINALISMNLIEEIDGLIYSRVDDILLTSRLPERRILP